MLKKIVVNGYPNSGKNTFVDFLNENCRGNAWFYEYDTVGEYKTIAEKYYGWDGESKTEEVRELISDLKQLDIKFRNGPFVDLVNYIEHEAKWLVNNNAESDGVVCIYCREPSEIKKIKDKYPDLVTVKIESPYSEMVNNSSDMSVNCIDYDYVIENSGTWEELREKAEKFYKQIMKVIK